MTRASIEMGGTIGAFDGDRLVGSARYHPMRQWWHGRSMPMAGVAGVKVAPEERGRGVGTIMMARLLADIADRGYPVSVLYPATAPLYRAFGWEFAGGKYQTVLPTRSLSALINPDEAARGDERPVSLLRRATPGDAAAIIEAESLVYARLQHCGPNTRQPWELRNWLDDPENFAYLADDGFLSYRWQKGTDELAVDELSAASAETARAFWRVLASHASMAATVRAWLAPADPVHRLIREPDAKVRAAGTWMLRIVDAAAAMAARGFPVGVTLSAVLQISDSALPRNAGPWRLEVAGGRGSLERADGAAPASALRLGARGLAALFAGADLPQLRLAGLAAGGDAATDDALAAAFGGLAFLIDEW